jgi:hypothetical protein
MKRSHSDSEMPPDISPERPPDKSSDVLPQGGSDQCTTTATTAEDRLTYRTGSALDTSSSDGTTLVMHVCNDVGKWGRGFVLAVSKVSPIPERAYRQWFRTKMSPEEVPFQLGAVQFVKVNEHLVVANMIGQRDIFTRNGSPPHRLEAVREAVACVLRRASDEGWNVQCPRIGCSLGGGSWGSISTMLREELERVPTARICVCTRPEDTYRA